MLARVVKYISLYLKIDKERKTWSLTSEPAFDPSWQKVTFDDINEIFKADPSSYHVEETRYPDGRFKSFTVETR